MSRPRGCCARGGTCVGVAEKACTLSVERIARFLAADLRQRKCDLDAAVTLPECGQEHVFAAAIAAICKCQSRLELHLCRGITERTRDVPGEARVFKTRECADDMTANFGIGIVKHRDEQRGRLLATAWKRTSGWALARACVSAGTIAAPPNRVADSAAISRTSAAGSSSAASRTGTSVHWPS